MVTPDEIDRYEQYQVLFPAVSATFFGSATAGTVNQTATIGLGNTVADYSRNVRAAFTGSASVSGTVSVTGRNQFGEAITESLGLAQGTQTSGGANGTSIFAEISAASVTFGTGVVGTGTVSLGVATAGTAARFGLPTKIASTDDVKAITWINAGLPTAINGGTIAAYVDTSNHSFAGTATLAGTMCYSVLFKTTYQSESLAAIANL
jgi:hypothetical protein